VAFDHVKRDLKLMSDEEKAAQEVRLSLNSMLIMCNKSAGLQACPLSP
jgi:hypothetical protein